MKAVRSQIHLHIVSLQYLPFLYCTRTILRQSTHSRKKGGQENFSTTRHSNLDLDGSSMFVVPNEKLSTQQKQVGFFKEKLRQKKEKDDRMLSALQSIPSPLKGNTSTITGKEQFVFKKIFKDIAAGSGSVKSKAAATSSRKPKSPIDVHEIFSIFSNAAFEEDGSIAKQKNKKNDDTAGGDSQRTPSASEGGRVKPMLSEQDREHVQKYPERLRKIATRATLLAKAGPQHAASDADRSDREPTQSQGQLKDSKGTQNDLEDAESKFSQASTAQKRAIDAICVKQMRSVSRKLIDKAALNESQLWKACEKEIFSLLAFLEEDPSRSSTPQARAPVSGEEMTGNGQLQRNPSERTPTTDSKLKSFKKDAREEKPIRSDTESSSSTSLRIPPHITPLPIISTLYPALLLLALRLFTTHYPFSPYIANLLPRIRALGLRSYVLGTTTQLYNTLLLHRWTVYSDLAGMDSLLNEMERGGVDFDAETVEVLERVRADKRADELLEKRAAEHERALQKSLQGLGAVEKKKRVKVMEGERQREREREADRAGGMAYGEFASSGTRAKAWWEGEVTKRWLDRVVGEWRGRVMERVRERGGNVAGTEAVVEREYASSLVEEDEEDGASKQGAKVWL